MSIDDAIPSEVDPDIECVPIESQTASGTIAAPPPGKVRTSSSLAPCPEGYVPRRRSEPYRLEGKMVVKPDTEPQRNPRPPDGTAT